MRVTDKGIKVSALVGAVEETDLGLVVGYGDRAGGLIVTHPAVDRGDDDPGVALDLEEVVGLALVGDRSVVAGESIHVGNGDLALALDDEGVDVLHFLVG
jgi:hypothetical protein